jgi:uncharacterized membrane protein
VLPLALAAFVGVLLLVNYDWFVTGFHSLFFDGDSWRFAEDDTLRRLFPDQFWGITAAVVAGAAVLQAVAVLALARLWPRRRRRSIGRELPMRASSRP